MGVKSSTIMKANVRELLKLLNLASNSIIKRHYLMNEIMRQVRVT